MSHTGNRLCYTVNAQVVYKNKVLLIYHKDYNAWLSPGGHVENEERPDEAIFRELMEETGLTNNELTLLTPQSTLPEENIFEDIGGKSLPVPHFVDMHRATDTNFHLAFRYFFTSNSDKIKVGDMDIKKFKWFTKKDLADPKLKLRKHVKYYANFALDITSNHQ